MPDANVARVAARQHGVVSRAQLIEAGVASGAIEHRVRTGKLYPVHRGVYSFGYRPNSPLARAMGAVLACGPGAVLSHRSAAALWELGVPWDVAVEVTAGAERRCRGVTVHQSRTLTPRHVAVRAGIPVTTVARTLLDLADVLPDRPLARAVNEAQVRHRLRLDQLVALLDATDGRRGAPRLQRILALSNGAPTRSVLEDTFLALVDREGLPRPLVNQRVGGYEVDMLWPSERLIVELDGRRFHENPRAFERDRERDADLAAARFTVVRVTWQRLARQPQREAQRLRALLAR